MPVTNPDASGAVQLAMGVNAEGIKDTCGNDAIQIDDTHSALHLYLKLPLRP
jgi:hypothetical protein